MVSKLIITDGTVIIDLLNGPWGLVSWSPAALAMKGGGVWASNAMSDGGIPIMQKWDDVTETLQLTVTNQTQDHIISEQRVMRQMLNKARAYYQAQWADEPVWIEARGPDETESRYAFVKTGAMLQDSDPFGTPFGNSSGSKSSEHTVQLIHTPWMEYLPADGLRCVEFASGSYHRAYISAMPTASADDCYVDHIAGTINTAGTVIYAGNSAGGNAQSLGIRFRSVTIPPGSKVLHAALVWVGGANVGNAATVYVYGEANATPAVFSTYADFIGRVKTTAYYEAQENGPTVLGTTYTEESPIEWPVPGSVSPADQTLESVIQEIIDLAGWASGNDLVLIIDGSGGGNPSGIAASSFDHLVDPEPILYIWYQEGTWRGDDTAGCTPDSMQSGGYVTNKHSDNQITHAYHYTAIGPAWSANLIGSGVPYALLPNPYAVGDILYLGCEDTLFQSGPFSGAVFTLSIAKDADGTLTWEYWNGAAWTMLGIVDSTQDDGTIMMHALEETGYQSVWWTPPPTWATTAINGITAWWVRARVTVIGGAPVAPVQQSLDVFTPTWPYAGVAEAEIGGDIEARSSIELKVVSAPYGYDILPLWRYAHWVMVGLRSQSRGETFRAYVNAGNHHMPPNVRVTSLHPSAAITQDNKAPDGYVLRMAVGAGTTYAPFCWEYQALPDYPLTDWFGEYHAFLRYRMTGGTTGELQTRLRLMVSDIGTAYGSKSMSYETPYAATENTDAAGSFGFLDFGLIHFPPGWQRTNIAIGNLRIWVDLANSGAGGYNVDFVDLVLIPSDEYLGVFEEPCTEGGDHSAVAATNKRVLSLDSITELRRNALATVTSEVTGYALAHWISMTPGPIIFQANADQRVYFFFMRSDQSDSRPYLCEPDIMASLRLYACQQYYSMRGES